MSLLCAILGGLVQKTDRCVPVSNCSNTVSGWSYYESWPAYARSLLPCPMPLIHYRNGICVLCTLSIMHRVSIMRILGVPLTWTCTRGALNRRGRGRCTASYRGERRELSRWGLTRTSPFYPWPRCDRCVVDALLFRVVATPPSVAFILPLSFFVAFVSSPFLYRHLFLKTCFLLSLLDSIYRIFFCGFLVYDVIFIASSLPLSVKYIALWCYRYSCYRFCFIAFCFSPFYQYFFVAIRALYWAFGAI